MMQTQRTPTEKKKAPPLLLLTLVGLMLTALLSAYYPSLANAQQGPTTITATGMLVGSVDDGDEDPTPEFRLTDEEAGRTLNLTSGFVDLEAYAGQRVTVEGVRVPGIDPNAYNVTQIRPAADEDEDEDPPMSCQSLDCPNPGNPNDEEVTLSFELEVEGEPPADAEFLGLTATESLSLTPLTDPDGDGTYTGSQSVAKFAPGGPPEPISISPVRIVQGPPKGYTANGPEYRVIKDFGTVKLDEDKTLSASVSFDDDDDEEEPAPGEEVSATGVLERLGAEPVVVDGIQICELSTHAITDEATGRYYDLKSDAINLDAYAGQRVSVHGESLASPDIGGAGAERCPDLEVTRIERAGTPPPDDNDGSDNNGGSDNDSGSDDSGSGGGSGSGGSGSSGSIASGIRGVLPSTGGGMALWVLGAGVLIMGGGLLVRRLAR